MPEAHPSVTYALTEADQLAFAWDRAMRGWLGLGAIVVAVCTSWAAFVGVVAMLPVPLMLGAFAWFWVMQRDAIRADVRAKPLHGTSVTVAARPDALVIGGVERFVHPWSVIGAPRVRRSSILLPVGPTSTVLIPRRAFVDRAAQDALCAAITRGRQGDAPIDEPDPPGPWDYDLSWTTSYADVIALGAWMTARSGRWWNPVRALSLQVQARRAWRRTGPDDLRFLARPDGWIGRGRSFHRAPWSMFGEIGHDGTRVFLFLSPRMAWIVPRQAIGDERFEQFVRDVTRWRDEAPPLPLPVPDAPAAHKVHAPDPTNPFDAPGAG